MRAGLFNPPHLDFNSYRQMMRGLLVYHYDPKEFTTAVTGTGVATLYPNGVDLRSGTTASSDARAYLTIDGLHPALTVGGRINFDYPLDFAFWVSAEDSNANFRRRVQIKNATTHAVLAESGFGIELQNLALFGESYGSSLATLNLSTTLTSGRAYKILISHYPGSRIEWYVDGILVGTQSTAANIPSGTSTTARSIVATMGNEAAAASGKLFAGAFQLMQKVTT